MDERWLYLAGLKDVFTCEIVGYAMGERMTQDLTARALFREVQQRRPAPGLIHHSDRGSQYCALAHRQLLDQFGMLATVTVAAPMRSSIRMGAWVLWVSCTGTKPPIASDAAGRKG